MPDNRVTLGLVALGDSITAGDGEPMLDVPVRTWAHWLARALDLPYTEYAQNAATAASVLAEQVPRVRPGHALAVVYVGVNDVRTLDWDPPAFEAAYAAILDALAERAERVLACLLPEDLGRPSSAPKPAAANAIISALAGSRGVVLADLTAFGGWTHVLPDTVHPTALGQLAIADIAARAVGAPVLPSVLADAQAGRAARLGWTRRYALLLARDLGRRAVERVVFAIRGWP